MPPLEIEVPTLEANKTNNKLHRTRRAGTSLVIIKGSRDACD